MLNISGILSQNLQTNQANPAANQQQVAPQHQYPHGAQANQNHNPNSSPLLSNKIVNSPFLQSLFPQVNSNNNQGGAAAHHGTANMS